MSRKINRVVYRFWHDKSIRGRAGYIGKDKYHPSRFNIFNRVKNKRHIKLYGALKKYPASIWRREILASGFRTDAGLVKAEIYWIAKFNSYNKGYNCTKGGGGHSAGASDETKRKMSLAHTGKKLSKEHRKKLSISKMGNASRLGQKHTPETLLKMSLAKKGKRFSKKHRQNLREAWKNRRKKYPVLYPKSLRLKISRGLKLAWSQGRFIRTKRKADGRRTET
jgi:hypothetical protein